MWQLLILLCFFINLSGADLLIGFESLDSLKPKTGLRIIGGTNAKLGEFPWQASLQIVPNDKNAISSTPEHYCGGSILTPMTILTAGHCVTDYSIDPEKEHIQIQVGLIQLDAPGEHAQTRLVVNTSVHPDFVGGAAPNDIAILILDKPLLLGEFVKTISLPQKGKIPTGLTTLSGWGTDRDNDIFALQRIDLPIIQYVQCFENLDDVDTPFDATMVCTGPLTGGEAACSGDSGSPLIQTNGDTVTQVGIVSWGFLPCGKIGRPTIHTRVSNFIDWIIENVVV